MKKDDMVSDIERSKELFEYEMTDVLIKLKGEFAAVNGKDISGDDIGMEVEPVNIRLQKPGVKVEKPGTGISAIPSVGPVEKFGKTSIEKINVSCPAAPVFRPAAVKKSAESPKEMMKRFEKQFDMKRVDMDKFRQDTTGADLKKAMPSVAAVPAVNVAGISLGGRAIDEFTVSVAVPKAVAEPGKAAAVSVDRSAMPGAAVPAAKVPVIGKTSPAVKIAVTAVDTAVSIPAVKPADTKVTIGKIKGTDIPVKVMEAFKADLSTEVSVSVAVPDTTMPRPDLEEFKGLKAELPKLPEVPEKPDFSGYIDDILESFRV